MIDFKKYGGKKRILDVADPLKLFESLDVKTSHTTLRPAQVEAIQALGARRSERDHVLKMNTGAGKTTAALLYLRSHAAEKHRPVVYLCPTIQLVDQVVDEADKLGIAAVHYRAGEPHPDPKGMSGEAVIVCAYEKLFNARRRSTASMSHSSRARSSSMTLMLGSNGSATRSRFASTPARCVIGFLGCWLPR